MRNCLICLLALILPPGMAAIPSLFLIPTPATNRTVDADALEKEVLAPYVQVTASWSGTGAGTVIEVDGEKLILTAGHVVEGYASEPAPQTDEKGNKVVPEEKTIRKITIRKETAETASELEAAVLWYSPPEEQGGNDLALLRPYKADTLRAAPLLDRGILHLGESTWYIGTPAGLHARLERSIVAVRGFRLYGRNWTITNGCGYYGSSGGGLYVLRDGRYVLAGVVTRMFTNNPKGALLVKTPADIRGFLESYKKHKGGK